MFLYYCISGNVTSALCGCTVLIFHLCFMHLAYNRTLGVLEILEIVQVGLCFFSLVGLMTMALTQIQKIVENLRVENVEEAKMCNRLHEGLIISKPSQTKTDFLDLIYSNLTANKIVNQFLGNEGRKTALKEDIFDKPVFYKVTSLENTPGFDSKQKIDSTNLFSLKEVIAM